MFIPSYVCGELEEEGHLYLNSTILLSYDSWHLPILLLVHLSDRGDLAIANF